MPSRRTRINRYLRYRSTGSPLDFPFPNIALVGSGGGVQAVRSGRWGHPGPSRSEKLRRRHPWCWRRRLDLQIASPLHASACGSAKQSWPRTRLLVSTEHIMSRKQTIVNHFYNSSHRRSGRTSYHQPPRSRPAVVNQGGSPLDRPCCSGGCKTRIFRRLHCRRDGQR
jgi:hypothetical protein